MPTKVLKTFEVCVVADVQVTVGVSNVILIKAENEKDAIECAKQLVRDSNIVDVSTKFEVDDLEDETEARIEAKYVTDCDVTWVKEDTDTDPEIIETPEPDHPDQLRLFDAKP